MAQEIYIVGGIIDECDRNALLAELKVRASEGVNWEWSKAVSKDGWRVLPAFLQPVLAKIRSRKGNVLKVVLLKCTNKQTKKSVYDAYGEGDGPVLAPDCATGEALIDWLVSPQAGLIPGLPWIAELRIAAFFCLAAKLLKNKSFCKDMHNHNWTKEDDLLGQAPVSIPDRPEVRKEALDLLARMDGILLQTKGASQGKTKKEWAIPSTFVPAMKLAFLERSLNPLKEFDCLAPLLDYLESGKSREYRLDSVIQEERIRHNCREHPRVQSGS